jgi:hypothetical protein
VRSYERLRFAPGGPAPKAPLADAGLRASMLKQALDWAARLGLKPETAHDAFELLRRAGGAPASSPGAGGDSGGGAALLAAPGWRLALAACLVLAARQGEHPAALPSYDAVSAATGACALGAGGQGPGLGRGPRRGKGWDAAGQ